MFRKTFWLSKKALAEQTRRPHLRHYIWGSIHRVQKMFGNRHPLNSTSAGESTIQNFAAQESRRTQTTFEDPDYQVVSPPARVLQSTIERRDGFGRSAIETFVYGQAGFQGTRAEKGFDLEKNETLHTTRLVTRASTPSNSRPNSTRDPERAPHESENTITSGNLGG